MLPVHKQRAIWTKLTGLQLKLFDKCSCIPHVLVISVLALRLMQTKVLRLDCWTMFSRAHPSDCDVFTCVFCLYW